MSKKNVVFGFLGTNLDAGTSDKRWERWRPTVALFGHEHFKADALELFVTKQEHLELARRVAADIGELAPQVEVNAQLLPVDDPWNFAQVYAALHEFARQYPFDDETDYHIHLTTGTHVAQICLFLLAQSRHFPAQLVETYSHGPKPGVDAWRGSLEVIDLDLSTYDQLQQRIRQESLDSQELLKGGIATRNAAFNQLMSDLERVALRSTAPVLLCGPTGAGKSALAQRVYDLRARRHLVKGAFIEVNCATLRGDNAMSALFGHKKGAFTGAITDRTGLLKSADKGMLFLDEVATLGLDEQAMLLRALEQKRFFPLGSDKEVQSDFQLVAGTNEDLRSAVAQGRFRADLLNRINLWQFELPGLASRVEDIEPNIHFELERAGRELGSRVTMGEKAFRAYMAFAERAAWPGNFRDLSSSITRMATLCEGSRIGDDDVLRELAHLQQSWGNAADHLAGDSPYPLSRQALSTSGYEAMDLFDLAQLELVLQVVQRTDTMAAAGREMFAASRKLKSSPNDTDRVRKYLARWGLDYAAVKKSLG